MRTIDRGRSAERTTGDGMEKRSYLANTAWKVSSIPFRHCIVRDVFVAPVHERFCSSFDAKLARARNTSPTSAKYDATILPFADDDRAQFAPLLEREFLSTLAKALDLDVIFEVDAAIHHHPAGSRTGWIHNDFNPGWFHRTAADGEVVLCNHDACNYRTGKTRASDVVPVQRMRHLTMLYYLNNRNWKEGDGGETGFYSSMEQPVAEPDVRVPPLDNSMVLLECSPHSYHSFLSSR
jgi:2OG-Fe(II) oxygenase superfamily